MIRELTSNDILVNGAKTQIKGLKNPGLLLIWAGYCGHCIRFKPTYNELDKKLGSGFTLMALENTEIANAATMNALGVQGYPTLKFVDANGFITADYNGSRDLNSLLSHICKFYHSCV